MIAAEAMETAECPFPLAVGRRALSSEAAAALRNWFSSRADWEHQDHGFYRTSCAAIFGP